MAWQIEIGAAALRQLRKTGHSDARRIRDYLRQRVQPLDDPRQLGMPLKGELAGLWRYRVGDHRIICEIVDERITVIVIRIGHRREVYR